MLENNFHNFVKIYIFSPWLFFNTVVYIHYQIWEHWFIKKLSLFAVRAFFVLLLTLSFSCDTIVFRGCCKGGFYEKSNIFYTFSDIIRVIKRCTYRKRYLLFRCINVAFCRASRNPFSCFFWSDISVSNFNSGGYGVFLR